MPHQAKLYKEQEIATPCREDSHALTLINPHYYPETKKIVENI